MKQKKKPKIEFSKKIFYILISITLFVVLSSIILMWYTKDVSALSYLIPSTFGALGIATGFYFNKAKLENKIKLEKKYGIKIEDTEDVEETENL